jgi:DMSO/TMAO reductase YedYZ molybdopterin-dependent catalytic subunit
MRVRSRRSFLAAGVAALGGIGTFGWIRTRPTDDGALRPLRRALEINEQIWRNYFSSSHLAPAFPREMAGIPRENGGEGLRADFDPGSWKLNVLNTIHRESLEWTLDDVKALPRVEMVTELHCIEGWSQVVHWAGARFSSLVEKVGFDSRYVGMETPGGGYYVGLDMASAVHPQTLLCYEMNGRELTPEHGAPLRLATPVKYGIKNIKRIGTIRFTNTRPPDYWAEQGYDWYAGL